MSEVKFYFGHFQQISHQEHEYSSHCIPWQPACAQTPALPALPRSSAAVWGWQTSCTSSAQGLHAGRNWCVQM